MRDCTEPKEEAGPNKDGSMMLRKTWRNWIS